MKLSLNLPSRRVSASHALFCICKKRLLTLGCFVLLAAAAYGQKEQYLEVKVGVNAGNYTFKGTTFDPDTRNAFTAGIGYEYFITKQFSIGGGILYNPRGYTDEVTYRDDKNQVIGGGKTTLRYNYVSVPIKAGFTSKGRTFLFANIALLPSFFVGGKAEFPQLDSNSKTVTMVSTKLDSKDLRKVDVGGMIEAGGGYRLKRCLLFLSLAYQRSFTPLTRNSPPKSVDLYNYGIALTAGMKCRLRDH
jgi:hypothetical protein